MNKYINTYNLPLYVIKKRISVFAPNALVEVYPVFDEFTDEYEEVKIVNADPTLAKNALSTPATIAELEEVDRVNSADQNAKRVVAINKLTTQQARTWLRNKVHSGVTEQSLTTAINNATTVADLKPTLLKMVSMIYAQKEADEEILSLLLALRDKTMPDL